jgi:hypothetical protein
MIAAQRAAEQKGLIMLKRFGGRRPSPSLVISLVALFVALGGTTYAATGGSFILGNANTATTASSLSAPIAGGKTLQLMNTSMTAGSTALGLSVAAGKAPLTVNSSGKVTNLNVDRIDSLDSTAFLKTTGKAADSNLLDGIDSTGFYAAGDKVADSFHADSTESAFNSGQVDGYDADGLVRAARASTFDTTAVPGTCCVTYTGPLSITAPSDGFVIVTADVTIFNNGCTTACTVDAFLRHIQGGESSVATQDSVNGTRGSIPKTYVFAVIAGVNTFDVRLVRHDPGSGTLYGWWGEMSALFVPFGPTGTGTLGAASATVTGPAMKK